MQPSAAESPDLWLSREEAAAALLISPRSLDRYVKRGQVRTRLRPRGDGRKPEVRYSLTDIDNLRKPRTPLSTIGKNAGAGEHGMPYRSAETTLDSRDRLADVFASLVAQVRMIAT